MFLAASEALTLVQGRKGAELSALAFPAAAVHTLVEKWTCSKTMYAASTNIAHNFHAQRALVNGMIPAARFAYLYAMEVPMFCSAAAVS